MSIEMSGDIEIEEQKLTPLVVGKTESSFGGEKIDIIDPNILVNEAEIKRIARKGEPDEQIYKNNPELCKEPLEAAEHVKIPGFIPNSEYPEEAVIAQIAKLQCAEDNLNLTPKQRDVFEGHKENQKGALGFISGMAGAIKNPTLRHKVISGGLATLEVIGLAGCVKNSLPATPELTMPPQNPIVETLTASPTVEATNLPGFIPKETASYESPVETETPIPGATNTSESNPASTETATATATAEAPIIEVAPYPSSIREFENGTSVLRGTDAEERIKALGAGEDLQALKDWYTASGIPTSMQEVVIGENETGAHWNIMIKYGDGSYGVITLTSGAEAGKIVRDGGLVSYLYSEDKPTFTYSKLINPQGYEGMPQKVVMSDSLWFAFAIENNDKLSGWANFDMSSKEEWVDLQVLATPTSEVFTIDQIPTIEEELTAEQIGSLTESLKSRLGIWEKNARYDSRDTSYEIKFMIAGDLLDYQDNPLIVQIFPDEQMKVLVAIKGYYLDNEGALQEIISPVVAQMPDGKMFSWGFDPTRFTTWTIEDDLIEKIKQDPAYQRSSYMAGKEDSAFRVFYLPDVQAYSEMAKSRGNNLSDYYDTIPGAYITQWIDKYNLYHNEETQEFIKTGKGLKFMLPWRMAPAQI